MGTCPGGQLEADVRARPDWPRPGAPATPGQRHGTASDARARARGRGVRSSRSEQASAVWHGDRVHLHWPLVPRLKHEALVHLVRNSPAMVIELLGAALGVALPLTAIPRPTAAEITDLDLAEYRADGV